MSIMSRPSRNDGYYDDNGQWQRTKFCFMSCGRRCTCGPPNGQYYSEQHDKRKQSSSAEGKPVVRDDERPILEDHCDKHGPYRINAAGCPACYHESFEPAVETSAAPCKCGYPGNPWHCPQGEHMKACTCECHRRGVSENDGS